MGVVHASAALRSRMLEDSAHGRGGSRQYRSIAGGCAPADGRYNVSKHAVSAFRDAIITTCRRQVQCLASVSGPAFVQTGIANYIEPARRNLPTQPRRTASQKKAHDAIAKPWSSGRGTQRKSRTNVRSIRKNAYMSSRSANLPACRHALIGAAR